MGGWNWSLEGLKCPRNFSTVMRRDRNAAHWIHDLGWAEVEAIRDQGKESIRKLVQWPRPEILNT